MKFEKAIRNCIVLYLLESVLCETTALPEAMLVLRTPGKTPPPPPAIPLCPAQQTPTAPPSLGSITGINNHRSLVSLNIKGLNSLMKRHMLTD